MGALPRIRITGDLEGAYVVLAKRPNGQLKIAPEQPDGLPRIVKLKRTTWACPTQWVATLADGRTVYARSHHGEFSVGVGDDLDDAVLKGSGPEALYFEYVEDSPMGFSCIDRLEQVRNAVIVVNVHAMSRNATARDFDYVTRASVYVWVASSLEEFVKRFVQGLIVEINASGTTRNQLRESLLALDNARQFEALHSLRHPRDIRKWVTQIQILRSVGSQEDAVLSSVEEHWPVDGSTLHRGHLEAIWEVFGLAPDVVPSPRLFGFLTNLAENRTRAAHGEESPVTLGRQQSYLDVMNLVDRAEELVSHMLDRGTSYLIEKGYLRT